MVALTKTYFREVRLIRSKYYVKLNNIKAYEGCVAGGLPNYANPRWCNFIDCFHSLRTWLTHNIMWDH